MKNLGYKLIDKSRQVLAAYDKSSRDGMAAVGNLLVREVKTKHTEMNYYKGGAFRHTLGVRASVNRTAPEKVNGSYQVRVGTKFIQALYWELGHYNVFTGKNEPPVKIWMPTLLEQREAAQQLFAATVKRSLGMIR
jgi:hypothetical protein